MPRSLSLMGTAKDILRPHQPGRRCGQRPGGAPIALLKSGLSLLALSALILAACGDSFVKDRETFYFALNGEPNFLNYVPYSSSYEADVIRFLYEPLMEQDIMDNHRRYPALATNITVSPDHLSYTVYLRPDVAWEDGRPVTTADIEFTINAIRDPASGALNKIDSFKDFQELVIESPQVCTLRFSKPDVSAMITVAALIPIPKHVWEGKKMQDPEQNRKPVGNGPYRFESWETGRLITLVTNPRYAGTEKPFFRRIVFRLIPETAARLAALKKGTVDLVERLRQRQWQDLHAEAGFKERFVGLAYDSTAYSHIAWQGNGSNPFFADPRVRRAMTMLLDRKQIIEKIQLGMAAEQSGPFYPTSWANDPEVKPLPFDPAAAEALLDEAGWKRPRAGVLREKDGQPFSFQLLVPQGSDIGREIAVIFKENLARVGIELQLLMIEWSVFNKRLNERDFQACTFMWNNTVDPEIYGIWHSSMTNDGSNVVGYANPEVDRLLEQARMEFNQGKRQALSRRIHRLIAADQPYTFLSAPRQLDVHDIRLQGVRTSLRGVFDAYPGFVSWTAP